MPEFRRKQKRTTKKGNTKKEESESEEEVASTPLAPNAEAKAQAAVLKDEGNVAFAAGNWLLALGKFTEAIEVDATDHVFFSNRSGTNLNLLRTRDAVADAEDCVRLSPSWAKGYSRLGAALLADKQAVAAKAAYDKGLRLDGANAALIQGLAAAKPAAEAEMAAKAKQDEEKQAKEAPVQAPVVPPEESTVIGIDLGTTFSCVAVYRDGAVEILEDESGSRTTPSFVAFTQDGARLVGEPAKAQAAKNPANTLFDIKRILGQKFGEPKVREDCKRFPFQVVPDPDTDDPRVVVEALQGKQMPPEQISALVLAHMKRIAEHRLGHPVKKAVVTVPAYFNDAQRTATKAAGTIAGLDVLRIINEPTAAALAYGLDQKESGEKKAQNVLIYDLGGGTFDVSVLRIEDGVFEVKGTGGDTHLGGEDFDNTVVDHFVAILKEKYQVDAKTDLKLNRKLKTAVEKAKRTLSSGMVASVEFDDYNLELTRDKFDSLNKATFDRTLTTVNKVLKDAKIQPSDIDDIVLVGGSTRIPRIQEALSQTFGGRQLCRTINPDEAVAYGAAVQGAILSGVRHSACQQLLLIDVTPLSLGIELEGKRFSVIIPRNSSIPCKKSSEYTTTENYQTGLEVCVYEGERPCIDGNRLLGQFHISGIESAKKGEPKVDVTFALDANGILEVKACDKKTGASADCRIEGACKGLDPADIARMVNEAQKFAEEDKLYQEQAEMRQELEELAYDIRDGGGNAEAKKKAGECLEWLEDQETLGQKSTGRALEKWLTKLREL